MIDLDVVVAEQLRDAEPLGCVVLDDQQALARGRAYSVSRSMLLEPLRRRRLVGEGEGAAREPVLPLLVRA